ncbi:MAG TPA: DUF6220 domain-containing protein [Chloroflexota bacterium]|jgi:hypothetical protein|nr:DUF6220 domain-containing protein [Chloroflexota bacterium]
MTRVLRGIWTSLIWLFAIMIPIQFYLAGHGAMEGAHAADKAILPMKTAWDPHVAFGTLMLLVSLLVLLTALAARPPARLLGMSAGLFVLMIIQFVLPFFNDSASTRGIAALHAVNALLITGIIIGLIIRSRPYWPAFANGSEPGSATP